MSKRSIAAPYINEAWLLPGPTAGSGYLDELAPVHLIGDGVDYGGSGDPSYIFETVSLGGDATGDGQGDLLVGSLEKGAWLVPMFSP